jgi:predicted dehydrogenase
MTENEVAGMLEAARSGGATLMVNNCRRLFPAYRKVSELLHRGEYGKLLSVEISDGSPFDWNSASAFYLRDIQTARGVFLDRGAHTIDILCWWLADQPRVVEARYDALGGGEALMDVQLACGDTSIRLKFGRLYKLANCYTLQCANAQITGRLFDASSFRVLRHGRTEPIAAGKPFMYHEYAWKLVENFLGVIQGRERPLFEAADVAPSIAVIDEAYRRAIPFESPWYEVDPNIALLKTESGK